MSFFTTFYAMWLAVLQLFLAVLICGALARFNVVPERLGKDLSGFIIRVLLPCMIFAKVVGNFNPGEMSGWWLLPLAASCMSLAGIGLAALVFFSNLREHLNILPLGGIQNAGFLVLSVATVIFPDSFDRFAAYLFLFLIGFDLVLWSLGKVLVTSGSDSEFKLREVISPPLVTMIGSVVIVLVGLNSYIPNVVMNAADLMGSATVPMAMAVLGLTLGKVSLKQWPPIIDIVKLMSVKYVMLPLLTGVVLIMLSGFINDPLLGDLMILEASAAPATSIMIQISNYGGDHQKVGSMMIVAYGLVLFFMPLWIALWRVIS